MEHFNDHWKLTCMMRWELKPRAPDKITCPGCNGKRYYPNMVDYRDPEIPCSTCNGNGVVTDPKQLPKPEKVPDELFERMKKTWCDYFAEKDGEAWTA